MAGRTICDALIAGALALGAGQSWESVLRQEGDAARHAKSKAGSLEDRLAVGKGGGELKGTVP